VEMPNASTEDLACRLQIPIIKSYLPATATMPRRVVYPMLVSIVNHQLRKIVATKMPMVNYSVPTMGNVKMKRKLSLLFHMFFFLQHGCAHLLFFSLFQSRGM
jgi:hypothetical protein